VRHLGDTRDQRRQVEIAVAAACRIQDRAGHAIDVLRAAAQADPDIAALWDTARRQRRQDVRAVTALLTATGPSTDLRGKEVVDVVYALTSPELHDLFVRDCGWRRDRFERWLADAILQLALATMRAKPSGRPRLTPTHRLYACDPAFPVGRVIRWCRGPAAYACRRSRGHLRARPAW